MCWTSAKMKLTKITISYLLLLLSFSGLAQNKETETLYRQFQAATTNKAKIDLGNQLSWTIRSSDPDSAMVLANQALLLAEKENYAYGQAHAHLCINLACAVKSNYETGLEHIDKAQLISDKLKNDSLLAACNLNYAGYYYNKSNYSKSIEKSLAAVKLFEKLNDQLGVIRSKLLMAQVYQLKDDLPRAEAVLKEISSVPTTDIKIKVTILHTFANIYGMEGKYEDALALDNEGLALCDKENSPYLKSPLYDNMANCYMYSGKYDLAKKYFHESLLLDSTFSNQKQMADTYLNLGQLSMMQKKYTEAIGNLQHSISLSQLKGYKQGIYQAYLLLTEVFRKNNQSDSAIVALKTAYKYKDSMINASTENKIAELETVYQTEKKESQLKLQQAAITKKNYFIVALVIALALLTSIGFFFYRKRQFNNRMHVQQEVMKQQDISTKAIIEAEENERKRIAAELHDGVGQLMSAAKMNLSVFEHELTFSDENQKKAFENVINLVDESCREIRSVSHQMMPNGLLKSGLASAVKEFIDKIDSRVMKVTLYTEGLGERIEANTETVLYRVIQECVNNVLKHSGANHLDISLIKEEDGIVATIEDNGHGFDLTHKDNFEGIGLKNIISRITYLKGTLDFDSKPGKGTVIAIHVPG